MLDDDDIEDMFSDESRTVVLDGSALKAQALADAQGEGLAGESVGEKSAAASQSEGGEEAHWAQQIERLNAQREAYIKSRDWRALVALYEDGVGLFEASERQQVYLTLAKLYELKLKENVKALENMALAFEMGGEEAKLTKIIEALRRLGQGQAKEALMAWGGGATRHEPLGILDRGGVAAPARHAVAGDRRRAPRLSHVCFVHRRAGRSRGERRQP